MCIRDRSICWSKDFSRWLDLLCAAFVWNMLGVLNVEDVATTKGTAAKADLSNTGLNIVSTASGINI